MCSGYRLNHGTIVPFVIHISTLAVHISPRSGLEPGGAAWLVASPPLSPVRRDGETDIHAGGHMHEAAVPVEQNMH